jgi:hypothetical protein
MACQHSARVASRSVSRHRAQRGECFEVLTDIGCPDGEDVEPNLAAMRHRSRRTLPELASVPSREM